MYIFESRYKNLTFYHNKKLLKFNSGMFVTDDEDVAESLKECKNAILKEEPVKRGRKPKED